MYQQKDDDVAASQSPRPSRLPIRQLPAIPDPALPPEPILRQSHIESPTPRLRSSGIPVSVIKSTQSPSQTQSPVRQPPLPDPLASQQVASRTTAPLHTLAEDEVDLEEDNPLEPPPAVDLIPRMPSPGRYIHGAPLHNVMEEEEED
ncbi:uncharacterized protein EI90DRAFT_3061823 [Cantharellus anzutake]|uniref:uncharacterized protein n=1 Tax=Cantharellus anzutake TaxID=1750568 RepID=UPI00190349B2|nr:uncharacterized protein EI90DRAFT_3061823 [Cantharellus anzutake]KAF8329759.1 hypothetical protein EI90DRAFT_3061823 [Cantharellus anzutake]